MTVYDALVRASISPNRAVFTTQDRDGGVFISDRKKVCIVGAGCSQYPLQPDEENSWELWCCNGLFRLGFDSSNRFRADRWWEMHPFFAQTEDDVARLQVAPVDVYVLYHSDAQWVPRYIAYPLHLIKQFRFTPTFASTFAFQVSLAILHEMKTIRLVGIYMVEGREALIERANLLYWIGIAEGLGIEVQIVDCHENLLQHTHDYGYDYKEEKATVEEYCRDVLDSIARDGWRGSR